MPCSRGMTNENGEHCPYRTHEPYTLEGWQAWDLAIRCEGQLRMSQMVAIGLDFPAVLKMACALGYDETATAELLPSIENGLTAAINEKISSEFKNR